MAMKTRLLDLQDNVNFDPKSANVDRLFWVTGIDPHTETLENVVLKVMADSETWLSFLVPNSDGTAVPILSTTVYRKSLKPAWVSPSQATCLVKYGNLDAAPHESKGGKKPQEKPKNEMCGPEFSFDVSSGTAKIVRSLANRYHNKCNGLLGVNDAPAIPGNGIGYSDGKLEGVEIVTGQLKWTYQIKGVPVTPGYLEKLSWMVGTTNGDGAVGDQKFMGFEPYSLLFMGASGNMRAGDGWVVTYNFLAGKSKTDYYFPNAEDERRTKFEYVGAHDYVWATYEEIVRDGFTLSVPTAAYVERVYDSTLFADIFTAVP